MRWIGWTKLAQIMIKKQAILHMVRKDRNFFNKLSGYRLLMKEIAVWILKLAN
jgi:hypothetical protein